MTVISVRRMTPTVGKTELATSRVRTMAGIVATAGARVRIGQVVAGEGAGCIQLYAAFPDFVSIHKATITIAADPARVKLLHERETNPAGEVVGPDVYRTVFGDVAPDYSVIMQREYRVPRENLQNALSLLPEIEELGKSHDYKMMAVVPVIADDLGRLIVAYYSRTMEDLGRTIDEVGMSEQFQKIVTKANTFGTLEKSRVVKII
jgi:hypothetical protein